MQNMVSLPTIKLHSARTEHSTLRVFGTFCLALQPLVADESPLTSFNFGHAECPGQRIYAEL